LWIFYFSERNLLKSNFLIGVRRKNKWSYASIVSKRVVYTKLLEIKPIILA